jgi:hypothetical protein
MIKANAGHTMNTKESCCFNPDFAIEPDIVPPNQDWRAEAATART